VAFERILAATDFSAPGDAAVREAFELARQGGARLDLLHVIAHDPVPNPLYAHYEVDDARLPEEHARLRQQLAGRLADLAPDAARGASLTVTTHVREGAPTGVILALADECGADLLVVGTHGHDGLEHLILGSVAERLVRHAHCSVLVVRATAKPDAP
jgi:nucleotide-binding universal stress UspA family protein